MCKEVMSSRDAPETRESASELVYRAVSLAALVIVYQGLSGS